MKKEELFLSVIAVLKQQRFYVQDGEKRKKKHEFYPGYTLANEWREKICVHAETGVFPERLFHHRAPNMTDKEFHYIKNNYKQTTLPVFMDYLSVIARATIDSNWSISYTEDESEYKTAKMTLEEYLLEINLEEYWKEIIPNIKAKDANGVIAIKPFFIYEYDENDEAVMDEDGNLIADQTELPKPYPFYFCSEKLYGYKAGEYALALTDEKSEVMVGDKKVKEGMIFEYYDKDSIWQIVQYGKKSDWEFKWVAYFTHDWDRLPVFPLQGIPIIYENRIMYQSPFLFAVDMLDLALMNKNMLQCSMTNTAFPYRVMIGNPCVFENQDGRCIDGMIHRFNATADQHDYECPHCHGSGLKDRVSPLGQLLFDPKAIDNNGSKIDAGKLMYFVSPDPSILEFVKTQIAEDTAEARKVLHLKATNPTIKGSNDVTAMEIAGDQKQMYSFIKTISDQEFFIYECMIDAVGFFRYGANYKKPAINYPVSFDFKTEQDYMVEISEAIKNGLPPFVIHSIVYKFLQSYFYTDKETGDAFKLILGTDRLSVMQFSEITIGLGKGTIEAWEAILHDSASTFVMELVQENKNFFDQDADVQGEQLIDKAKVRAEQIKKVNDEAQAALVDSIANSSTKLLS